VQLFDQLHPQWQVELARHKDLIDTIDSHIANTAVAPDYKVIFRALSRPIDSTRVVIFGQDPYPTKGVAHGLAFSVDSSVEKLPPSLRNIYKELQADLGVTRINGDLSDWANQGVMLVNRILSTEVGKSMAHDTLGWQQITETVAQLLGDRDVIAVLWGSSALELKKYFKEGSVISSVHPSPLSAYRGFFGSQPFSKINTKLREKGLKEITW
jgi:uracil-DNA glycosylase